MFSLFTYFIAKHSPFHHSIIGRNNHKKKAQNPGGTVFCGQVSKEGIPADSAFTFTNMHASCSLCTASIALSDSF
jgi:hypothetical protein